MLAVRIALREACGYHGARSIDLAYLHPEHCNELALALDRLQAEHPTP